MVKSRNPEDIPNNEDTMEYDNEKSYLIFTTEGGHLIMTVKGKPATPNTIAAFQCADVFSLWLEHIGVRKAKEGLETMETEGNA